MPPAPPPAPSRRRVVSARAAPAPSVNKHSAGDALADDLSALRIAPTRAPLRAATAPSRSRQLAPAPALATVQKAVPSRPKPAEIDVHDDDDLPPGERVKAAKRAINASLQTLSTLSKSGWRGPTSLTIKKAVQDGASALDVMRSLVAREGPIGLGITGPEIERGASAMVSSLVEMGCYAHAVPLLIRMRESLLALWQGPVSPVVSPSSALAIPLPPPSYFELTLASALSPSSRRPSELVPLALSIQQFLLGCVFRSEPPLATLEDVGHMLGSPGGPVDWRELLHGDAEPPSEQVLKRADAMMVSMFGSITKACVGADDKSPPPSLLSLRLLSLLCLSTTPLPAPKLASFYDHLRKVLLLYGRASEKANVPAPSVSAAVLDAFERARERIREPHHDDAAVSTKWVELCEVVVHVARRAGDLETVERISKLMDRDASPTLPLDVDAPAQIAALCARLAAAQAVFESHFDNASENPLLGEHVRRSLDLIRRLTALRPRDAGETMLTGKVDRAIERVRHVVVKGVRKDQRLDQLIRKNGDASDRHADLLNILEAVAGHVEVLGKAGVDIGSLSSGVVDALLVLAYGRLVISDRTTHQSAFLSLERALCVVGATLDTSSAVSTVPFNVATQYSIRGLATSYYNIGGALFNEGRPEASIRFVRRACEIGTAVASAAPSEGTKETREEFVNLLAKRWELLGLALQAIGDRSLAHTAYVCAVVSQPPAVFASLATSTPADHSDSALFKLLQRVTKLATLDLLLPAAQVSIQDRLAPTGRTPAEIGAVLEMQLEILDSWSEKREAREAIAAVIEDLLAVTLLRRMEHPPERRMSAPDLSVEAAAAEIDDLCSRSAFGEDAHLRLYAGQYFAFSHLWLGFHAHQVQQPSAADTVEVEARSALRILRTALDASLEASPSGTRVVPRTSVDTKQKPPARAPPTTGRGRSGLPATNASQAAAKKATGFKTPQTSRTMRAPPKALQVTPPSGGAIDLSDRMSKLRVADEQVPVLDGVEKCYSQLETMAHLLGLLGVPLLRIAYLQFLRRLSSKIRVRSHTAFVAISAMLGNEYLRLGKTTRAGLMFAQADHRLKTSIKAATAVAPVAHIEYLMGYAAYLAVIGKCDSSAQAYNDALEMADSCAMDESNLPSSSRIVERTLLLHRANLAAATSSLIFQRQGDLTRSLPPALQAMRLSSRALTNIVRLAPPESSTSTTRRSSTFTADPPSHPTAPLPDFSAGPRKRPSPSAVRGSHTGLAWRLTEGFILSTLRVASLYSIQGTPKAAEHYAQQAFDLASEVGSPRLAARSLVVQIDVRLRSGKVEEVESDIAHLKDLLGISSCPESIDARRLDADLHMSKSLALEAHETYLQAQHALNTFESATGDAEATPGNSPPKLRSPAKSPARFTSQTSSPRVDKALAATLLEVILPTLQAHLLRAQVVLLRMQNRHSEGDALMLRLANLRVSEEDKADELRLLATIQLQELLHHFSSDPVLGMLPESVLSVPTLSIPLVKPESPRSGRSFASSLQEVDKLLARATNFSVARSETAKLRELSLQIATLRAFQCSTGKPKKRAAANVSTVLDLGMAASLSREMLETIDFKLGKVAGDDLVWPVLAQTQPPTVSVASDQELAHFWSTVRERHRVESVEATVADPAMSMVLPSNWTIVSVHLTVEHDGLILVRHRHDCDPLVFKLPLDRFARREGEEDVFSYDLAIGELRDIINASNLGTQRAKHVDTKEERVTWWKERKELDDRLRVLLEGVEQSWLGAFKTVFLDSRQLSAEAIATFKSQIERILRRGIVRTQEKKTLRFRLDDAILACLAALPPNARDEDLEDLYFYIVESFQFSGVPLAYDETDVDQVVCDLRAVLERVHAPLPVTQPPSVAPDEHIFLVLDKAVQAFPWESIPCLRGKSVSRIPSLAFLRDRMDLATLRPQNEQRCEIVVDSSKTAFVLNPGLDLKNTQATFEPWLDRMKGVGWTGSVGRAPAESEIRAALLNQDLFLYFGHGGAEQYVRSHTIRHLPRCAVTMLWGCSSGYLKDLGEYDPSGTPYNYMVAGCPALVANLWDVTDRDIDLLSQNVFKQIGLDGVDSPRRSTTLASAVATARDVCNLKYLNGAAPVVFGVPVRFV